jgi:cation diffusion facilitator CzcD-associated flavoprotein CzcO
LVKRRYSQRNHAPGQAGGRIPRQLDCRLGAGLVDGVQRSCSARLNRKRFWIVLVLGPEVLGTEEDDRRSRMTTETQDSPDAVVIGAGPAGLAVARELDHQHGIKALVLDRAAAPAISWRTRYDNFRLNTTGFLSHIPGQRIPLNAGRWPTKEDMVRYFDHYVQRQNIALRLGCEVHRVDRAGGVWQLDTSLGEIRTPAIVLATGNYSAPTIPPWPGLSRFNGEIVHSGDFTNAWPYRGRDVLVVGAGNSAADIAVQLANDGAQRIWLAVRTPPHLVRRAIGPFPSDIFLELFSRVPARMIDPLIARMNRLMWGDLSAYGFQRPPLGLKATVEKRGRIPTLADELIDAVRVGRVAVVGAVKAVESDCVMLADGTSVAPQVIVAATGFGTDLDDLVGHLGVLDGDGNPPGGFASHVGDGMFAIGYGIPPNGPLRAIRVNSTRLAREVAAYLNRIGPVQQCETVNGRISLAMQAEMARATSVGAQ